MINSENPEFSNPPGSDARPAFPYRPVEASPRPVVSVITPYYNTGEVVLETAWSLFNQSLQEWEWVIVDDGSTDSAALEGLAAVEKADPRVRVVRQPNKGPAAARNAAFRTSIGPYICMLDSDDLLEPTFLEKCVWFLESQPAFGFCNSWSVSFGSENFLWTTGFERGKEHLKANSGPNISVIRREAFAASGGFDESIRLGHEDWDFWLALANAGYWGHTLPEYLEWYRKRGGSRFDQVMSTASTHVDFEAFIASKYAGLEARFPSPQIKQPEPYETIVTSAPFTNRLAKSDRDRRILFLVPWLVTGGADKVNLDWIGGLTDSGYKVTVCATLQAHHNWLHPFSRLTPDIFILPNFLRLADFPRFLVYLIRSRQIDTVLITGSTIGYQLLPFLRCSCPEAAFVDLCHAEEPHWLNGGHPRFGVGYQDLLDLNIVTTGELRNAMIKRGADPARVEVCYSGINMLALDAALTRRNRVRTELRLQDGLPVIVYAGRICEQKRPQLFAGILRELSGRGVPFRALVVGDGELRPELENLIRKYSLESSVRMLGTVDHQSWLEILSAADIFLLPSSYEGISVALLEAMAMGAVPVVTSFGGQSEAVTSDCGVLIPHGPQEDKAYADAVSLLMANTEQRSLMARAGRARILSDFTHEQSIIRLLGILGRATELARTQPRQVLTIGLARELATLAVENTRLSGFADYLWSQLSQAQARGAGPGQLLFVRGVRRLIELVRSTSVGAKIGRNRLVRMAGKRLLQGLAAGHQPNAGRK
jgi:glycosyltransferase involved in cell wall biosynthesis